MKKIIFSLIWFFILTEYSLAKVIGKWGATYQIVERDAYEELMYAVKSVDWQREINKVRSNITKVFKVDLSLPQAKESMIRYHLYEYTLSFDIPDGKGNILYPKGYKFYPLQYISFPYTVVVFDASRREEVEWFKQSEYFGDPNVWLVITKGDLYALMEELKIPLYAANERLIEVFNIKVTPSIITQWGVYFKIKEV